MARDLIRLVPEKAKTENKPIKYFYTTDINKKLRVDKGKFKIKKYNPVTGEHEMFIEDKIK